jgi:hypothetical protein
MPESIPRCVHRPPSRRTITVSVPPVGSGTKRECASRQLEQGAVERRLDPVLSYLRPWYVATRKPLPSPPQGGFDLVDDFEPMDRLGPREDTRVRLLDHRPDFRHYTIDPVG